MIETHVRDGAILFSLDPAIQRRVMKCLCLFEIGQSPADRITYVSTVLQPIENRWAEVVQLYRQPEQQSTAKKQTVKLLERCRGVVQACSAYSWRPIYAFTKRLFRLWLQCIKVFEVDAGTSLLGCDTHVPCSLICADLILSVLKLISDCTAKLMDWLSEENDINEFLDELMHFFRVCDDCKLGRFQRPRDAGRRNRELEAVEDEKEKELDEILRTLEAVSELPLLKAAEATSFGLTMMFACITRDMLKV
jgi:hypothetical protein